MYGIFRVGDKVHCVTYIHWQMFEHPCLGKVGIEFTGSQPCPNFYHPNPKQPLFLVDKLTFLI